MKWFKYFLINFFFFIGITYSAENWEFHAIRLRQPVDQFPIGTLGIQAFEKNSEKNLVWIFDLKTRSWPKLKVKNEQLTSRILAENEFPIEDEVTAFIDDIELTLHLAREWQALGEGVNRYKAFVTNLESRLKAIIGKREKLVEAWPTLKKRFKHLTSQINQDRPLTLQKYRNLIESAGIIPSPLMKQILSDSVFVPLSIDWMEKNETTKNFLEKWRQLMDIHFSKGVTGEGWEMSTYKVDEHFLDYTKKLTELKNLVFALDDPVLNETSEYKWLVFNSFQINLTNPDFRRLIFVHQNTWSLELNNNQLWADYVCIAQDFGPVHSNPLLSVLIHELNVNTSNPTPIFPYDTHMDKVQSMELWMKGTSGPLPTDAESVAKILAINPFLGSAYISLYLKTIENELGLTD